MTKNQLAFVARLSREYPSKPVHVIAEEAKRLFALGRMVQRWAENSCNGIPVGRYPNGSIRYGWTKKDEEKYDTIIEKVETDLIKMGYVSARVSGDPRGCCLMLALPSGFKDDFNGDTGFCVPYQG